MNVQGFGAGVGRVGPYYEQGNWYRGGAVQMLFITWLYGEQNQVRPMFPPNTTQEDLIRGVEVVRSRAAAAARRLVEGAVASARAGHHESRRRPEGHLRRQHAASPTAGAMIKRAPNDPAWYKGGLWHDNMPLNVPGLWFMSWYDVSVGPESRDVQPRAQDRDAARSRISSGRSSRRSRTAPTRARPKTPSSASAAWATRGSTIRSIMYGFFDKFLKGERNTRIDKMPKVTYYTMGLNKWQTSDTWPPDGAQPMTFYLSSGGKANTLNGDGVLTTAPPATDSPTRSSTIR